MGDRKFSHSRNSNTPENQLLADDDSQSPATLSVAPNGNISSSSVSPRRSTTGSDIAPDVNERWPSSIDTRRPSTNTIVMPLLSENHEEEKIENQTGADNVDSDLDDTRQRRMSIMDNLVEPLSPARSRSTNSKPLKPADSQGLPVPAKPRAYNSNGTVARETDIPDGMSAAHSTVLFHDGIENLPQAQPNQTKSENLDDLIKRSQSMLTESRKLPNLEQEKQTPTVSVQDGEDLLEDIGSHLKKITSRIQARSQSQLQNYPNMESKSGPEKVTGGNGGNKEMVEGNYDKKEREIMQAVQLLETVIKQSNNTLIERDNTPPPLTDAVKDYIQWLLQTTQREEFNETTDPQKVQQAAIGRYVRQILERALHKMKTQYSSMIGSEPSSIRMKSKEAGLHVHVYREDELEPCAPTDGSDERDSLRHHQIPPGTQRVEGDVPCNVTVGWSVRPRNCFTSRKGDNSKRAQRCKADKQVETEEVTGDTEEQVPEWCLHLQPLIWNILSTEHEEIYSQGKPIDDSLKFLQRCQPLISKMSPLDKYLYNYLYNLRVEQKSEEEERDSSFCDFVYCYLSEPCKHLFSKLIKRPTEDLGEELVEHDTKCMNKSKENGGLFSSPYW